MSSTERSCLTFRSLRLDLFDLDISILVQLLSLLAQAPPEFSDEGPGVGLVCEYAAPVKSESCSIVVPGFIFLSVITPLVSLEYIVATYK